MKKIVVIDGHPAIRVALRSYLEKNAELIIADEAANGIEGVDKVKRHQPDLVILDPNLTAGDGLELIRRLKKINDELKILVLSGLDEVIYVRKTIEEGVDGFVSKSRELSVILCAVNSVLAGYRCFPVPAAGSYPLAGHADEDRLHSLSRRELAILQHIAKGFSNKQIAGLLFISEKTVSTHKARVLTKLNLRTSIDLARYARERNLV